MKIISGFTALLVGISAAAVVSAQNDIEKEEIVTGLNFPTAVAIQPDTGHVFVAESGAKRIVRIVDGEKKEVIVDFPTGTYDADREYEIGPLGMKFLDKDTLVVTAGGLPQGANVVCVFKVPGEDGDPIKADESEIAFSIEDIGDLPEKAMLWGMASDDNHIYITSFHNREEGWILRAEKDGDELKKPEKFELAAIDEEEGERKIVPLAVTVSPDNVLAVMEYTPGDDESGESALTFYDRDGKKLAKFRTGLTSVTAIAYDPARGRLFVTDFNWERPDEGGLYKLIEQPDTPEVARAEKIEQFTRATSIAFDNDGNLYVAVLGDSPDDDEDATGKIIKVKGLTEGPAVRGDVDDDIDDDN